MRKLLRLIFPPALLLLISACTTPIGMTQTDAQLAEIAQVPVAEAELIRYCTYGVIDPKILKMENYSTGAFLLTKDKIYLLKGSRTETSKRVEFVIPIPEIRGVTLAKHGLGRQVQIIYQGKVTFMEMNKDANFVDREASERVVEKLLERGVFKWNNPTTYFKGGSELGSLGELVPLRSIRLPE